MKPFNQNNTFTKGSLFAIFGKILTLLFSVASNAFLARLLSPQRLGFYFLAFSFSSILVTFSLLGLNQLIVKLIATEVAQKKYKLAAAYFRKSLILGGITSVVFGGIYAFSVGPWIGNRLYTEPILANLSPLIALWAVVSVFQSLFAEGFRGYKKIGLAVLYTGFLMQVLTLAFLLVTWINKIHLSTSDAIVISVLATGIPVSVAIFCSYRKNLFGTDSKIRMLDIAKVSLPFWLFALTNMILTEIDIWLLGVIASSEDVALYGAVLRIVRFVMFSLVIVNAVVPPFIADLYVRKEGLKLETILTTISSVAVIPSILIVILMILFGKYILGIVYGKFYIAAFVPLVVLSVGQLINVATGPGASVLAMTGYQFILLKLTILAVFVKIVFFPLAVQQYGILGGAAMSSLILAVYNYWIALECKRKINVSPMLRFSAYRLGNLRKLFGQLKEVFL